MLGSITLTETDWLGGIRAKASPEVMEEMGQKMMATSKITMLGLKSYGSELNRS